MKPLAGEQRLRFGAIILLLLIGFNALFSGFRFMSDPSGKLMGMSIAYLNKAPFKDFFVPGLVLFLAIGCGSVLVAIFTSLRVQFHSLMIVAEGLTLSGWILIQVLMVHDFNFLHFSCLAIGVALTLIGLRLFYNLRKAA